MEGKFTQETTHPFDFDAVINNEKKYTQGKSRRDIDISGRYCLEKEMIILGNDLGQTGNPVYGHQIHGIHHEDPGKNGQSDGAERGTVAVKAVFDTVLDHFDQKFESI